MALKVRVTLRAALQIEKASEWCLRNRLSAPGAVQNDIEAAFSVLVQQPDIGTKVVSTKAQGIRRLHLGRIRYFLFYRVKNGELVVLSFWHSSRSRGPVL